MKHLGQRYAQYFNRRYERTGTLWEGRFRSCVAESARYVLACYRYVELNPVPAGMVGHPSVYAWSSYAINADGREDPLVSPHPEMLALGSESRSRHTAYRALVEDGLDASLLDAIREATNGGYPLGSDSFKSTLMLPVGRKIDRGRPGPKPARDGGEERSGSDPELFSADGVS
jgi:REP-associated tyrosine transposase